jgi:hypothetical protein
MPVWRQSLLKYDVRDKSVKERAMLRKAGMWWIAILIGLGLAGCQNTGRFSQDGGLTWTVDVAGQGE